MINKKFLLSALAYLIATFTLAILWHMVLFEDLYKSIGYFGREEPLIIFGVGAIFTQGLVLAYIYPHFHSRGKGWNCILGMGIFLWSTHVIAATAKTLIDPIHTFVLYETVYLAMQFIVAGLLLHWIHKKS